MQCTQLHGSRTAQQQGDHLLHQISVPQILLLQLWGCTPTSPLPTSQLRPPGSRRDDADPAQPGPRQGQAEPRYKTEQVPLPGCFLRQLPRGRAAACGPGITELAMLFSPRLLGDWFISMNNSIPALISSAIKA